jgi:hypothetical protein
MPRSGALPPRIQGGGKGLLLDGKSRNSPVQFVVG